MCSNYEPIAKDRIHLLDLFEPTFEYKSHIYPNYEAPYYSLKKNKWNGDWLDLVWSLHGSKNLKKFITLTMQERKQFTKSLVSKMHGRKTNSV